jgi:S1-C subfamily serine protease
VQLRVETPDGQIVTGTTTVPGATAVSVRLATDSATFEGQVLEMDRQRDTIRIAVDAIFARALQVEVRWRDDPDEVAVYLFSDTLGVALPGDLFNPFEGDSGKPVFEVGREYSLAVAVTDSNYYDFVRSASDPFTGRGFLNRLEGGIGVFGSVAAYTYYLRVVR